MPSGSETASAPVGGTGYQVRLAVFEGPLDLLLHLIRINEIDITDIPIVEITRQYNETLDLMRELNLDVAGEYLVMASTLLQIKSKMLLPPDSTSLDDALEDPRSELARQLQEYERYRQAVLHLSDAESETLRTWSRPASLVSQFEGEASLEADLFALLTAFKTVLAVLNEQEHSAIRRDRVSLLDRIHWLLARLQEERGVFFSSLFPTRSARSDVIVTFLAVLELVRLGVTAIAQSVQGGEIEIRLLADPSAITIDPGGILDV